MRLLHARGQRVRRVTLFFCGHLKAEIIFFQGCKLDAHFIKLLKTDVVSPSARSDLGRWDVLSLALSKVK